MPVLRRLWNVARLDRYLHDRERQGILGFGITTSPWLCVLFGMHCGRREPTSRIPGFFVGGGGVTEFRTGDPRAYLNAASSRTERRQREERHTLSASCTTKGYRALEFDRIQLW